MKLDVTKRAAIKAGLACLALATALAAEPREETPDPGRADGPRMLEFASFKLIAERNIFNSNRSGGARVRTEARKPNRVDTLTLVGSMSYEKGAYAFFDGSSAEFRKVLEKGHSIADHKVTDICTSGVKLLIGTTSFDLGVGVQMRREEGGDWEVVAASALPATVPSSPGDSPGEENDVIKRLMQQREQELK